MPAANSKKSAAAVTPVAFKKKIGTCLREYRKAADFTQPEKSQRNPATPDETYSAAKTAVLNL